MPIRPPPPPQSVAELLERAENLAGRNLGECAARHNVAMPADLKRHKGWVGQLAEVCLGADAGNAANPDFTHLAIELKTIPVDRAGLPIESTYVCTAPLDKGLSGEWELSWLRRKLAEVLWLPVEGERSIPLAERRFGQPLLWRPSAAEEAQLRTDWEELLEMVMVGEVERLTARFGQALQLRPKAANARVSRRTVGSEGADIRINPRGFYLRRSFTAAILRRHFALPG